jgi:replicative DNA helicase
MTDLTILKKTQQEAAIMQQWAEASKQLIACCLIEPDMLDHAFDVKPEHLYGQWADVWASLQKRAVNGAVDLRGVLSGLPDDWRESLVNQAYTQADADAIARELVSYQREVMPVKAYVVEYVNRVKDAYRRQYNLETVGNLAKASLDLKADIGKAESAAVDRLVSNDTSANTITWMSEIAEDVIVELWHNVENPADIRGMITGLRDLDRSVGGFEPSNYVLIGARPSMGKSSLVFELAKRFGRQGRTGLALTSETSKRMFLLRMACASVGVNYQSEFKTGRLNPGNEQRRIHGSEIISTWDALDMEIKHLAQLDIAHIAASHTPAELYALAYRMQRVHGLEWVIVDTINLLADDEQSYNAHQDLTRRSAQLARIAHDLGILTIATWQLSRKVEDTSDKVPTLDHFRESGSGEEHADVAILLYRPQYYRQMGKSCRQATPGGDEITDDELIAIVAKNRDGQSARWVRLAYDRQFARVRNREVT